MVVTALGAALPGLAEAQVGEDDARPGGEKVHFRNGELELAGLWFTPAGEGPFPAAVIIRGSGESRRDNPWARLFVDVLLENDIAVLLPDKRGSGASEGDWRTATFTDLAGDALAAVRHVRSRPEVHPDQVGLVGLSQGGRVAPVAAARSSDLAFVVDVVGSAVPFVEQIDHEMEHTFREAGLTGDDLRAAMALHDVAKRYVRGEIPWDTYRSALDSALATEWRRATEGFPATEDHWRWEFFRGVVDFDPVPWWRQVEAPTLVLYGGEDSNTPTARSVERLRGAFSGGGPSRHEVRVFDGLGHGLLAPMEGRHHRLELHPDVVRALSGWLGSVLPWECSPGVIGIRRPPGPDAAGPPGGGPGVAVMFVVERTRRRTCRVTVREATMRTRPVSVRTLAALAAALVPVACARDVGERTETPSGALASVFGGDAVEWIDLTHPFDERTIYWPTAEPFRLDTVAADSTEGGWWYAANAFSAAEHGGTHLDAPYHFARTAATAEEIPLERLIGPAAVVDVSGAAGGDPDYRVRPADLRAWEEEHGRLPEGAIVLVNTGWHERWPDREAYLGTAREGEEAAADLHFPGLHPDAARWLVEERAPAAVGLDTPSLDHGQSSDFMTHRILGEAGIPGFENVARLGRLPEAGAWVVALPMKIAGGTGGPLRIVAAVPEGSGD